MSEKQVNPIDKLEDIRDIAVELRELALDHQLQMAGSMYIADEMARIIDLATSLLDDAKATQRDDSHEISFWLRFLPDLPAMDESQLEPRDWSISIDELEDHG